MAKVLIIDGDLGTRQTFTWALRSAAHQVFTAESARHGTAVAKELQPDIAILDLRLPDGDGLRVLRAVRQFSPVTEVIIVTGFGTIGLAVEAMQLGARHFLEKPVDIDVLLAVINQVPVVLTHPSGVMPEATQHALDRWVGLVFRTADLPSDPHTVALWSRGLGISAGAIRGWCRAAHLPVKGSLNFARVIRVLARFDGRTSIGDFLDIVDTRTLVRFLRFGDASAPPSRMPLSIAEFLERQSWIKDAAAIRRVRLLFQERLGETWTAQEPAAQDSDTVAPDGSRH